MNKVKCLSIDAEFTSFDMHGGDMISLAIVEVLDDLTLGREWQGFLKPRGEKYFTEGARQIHGISYFKALTFPERRDTMIDMLHFLSPLQDQFRLPVAFYGSWDFDLRWIDYTMTDTDLASSFHKAFQSNKEFNFNVLQMTRKNYKNMPMAPGKDEKEQKKGQYRLDNVCRFLGIDLNHHDSLSDARACAQILIKILKGENVWTGELF